MAILVTGAAGFLGRYLVRALWAGPALLWQPYPQHDGAHAAKLAAFLDWLQAPEDMVAWHRHWSGLNAGTSSVPTAMTSHGMPAADGPAMPDIAAWTGFQIPPIYGHFGVILALVASLNYLPIPGIVDADGRTFGIFALDIYDDALHLASALWALAAAVISARASTWRVVSMFDPHHSSPV